MRSMILWKVKCCEMYCDVAQLKLTDYLIGMAVTLDVWTVSVPVFTYMMCTNWYLLCSLSASFHIYRVIPLKTSHCSWHLLLAAIVSQMFLNAQNITASLSGLCGNSSTTASLAVLKFGLFFTVVFITRTVPNVQLLMNQQFKYSDWPMSVIFFVIRYHSVLR